MANEERKRNYHLKVTLERFAILDDHDPCWLGPGEIRFTCRVTPGDDESRAHVTRLPSVGVFKMHPGEQIIERVIFESLVDAEEGLEVQVTGVEEDFFGPQD